MELVRYMATAVLILSTMKPISEPWAKNRRFESIFICHTVMHIQDSELRESGLEYQASLCHL